jgi:predicted phage tail protein
MISIKLKGELANLFIPEFDCEASGMFEAIAALKANFPRIIGYLRDSAARGIGFYIKVGYQTIAESDLNKVFSKKVKSLTITPIPIGSGGGAGGGGLMKIILGVALIGLAFTGVGFLGVSPLTLGLLGGGMLLSGVSSFFGNPKDPNSDEKNGKKSLIFGGSETTVREGGRVPIIFGKHLSGWYVVSASIRAYKL